MKDLPLKFKILLGCLVITILSLTVFIFISGKQFKSPIEREVIKQEKKKIEDTKEVISIEDKNQERLLEHIRTLNAKREDDLASLNDLRRELQRLKEKQNEILNRSSLTTDSERRKFFTERYAPDSIRR